MLVHNNNACVAQSTKPVNLPSYKKIKMDMNHILSGHGSGGSRLNPGNKKTVFPEGYTTSQIRRAVLNAYKGGKRIKTQGDSVLVRGSSGSLRLKYG